MQSGLTKLKNIGVRSAEQLIEVGISSPAQIEKLGAVEVYKRLREQYPVSLTMLWALQGALLDLPFYQQPAEIKDALLDEMSRQTMGVDGQF